MESHDVASIICEALPPKGLLGREGREGRENPAPEDRFFFAGPLRGKGHVGTWQLGVSA